MDLQLQQTESKPKLIHWICLQKL